MICVLLGTFNIILLIYCLPAPFRSIPRDITVLLVTVLLVTVSCCLGKLSHLKFQFKRLSSAQLSLHKALNQG